MDVTRSEEELAVAIEPRHAGSIRVRKLVENRSSEQIVRRSREDAETERVPADDADTGEVITYDDGSISIPVLEERLVVEKRLVVKERVVVRKHTVTEEYVIEADLRNERIEVDADHQVAERVHADDDPSSSAINSSE